MTLQEGGQPGSSRSSASLAIERLAKSKKYLTSSLEVSMGPPLMTLGIALAVMAYLVRGHSTASVSLSLAGLTAAMVGSAMEMAFLLITSRAVDLLQGESHNLVLRILFVAASMSLYMVLIGMPIVGLYVQVLASRSLKAVPLNSAERDDLGAMFKLLWLYSLLTGGIILAVAQRRLSLRLVRAVESISENGSGNVAGQGAPEALSAHGQ